MASGTGAGSGSEGSGVVTSGSGMLDAKNTGAGMLVAFSTGGVLTGVEISAAATGVAEEISMVGAESEGGMERGSAGKEATRRSA